LVSGQIKRPESGTICQRARKTDPVPPALPIEVPPGRNWEVRLVALTGPFVISVRRLGGTYSNAVVEQYFGRPATTRNWNTIEQICEALKGESIK